MRRFPEKIESLQSGDEFPIPVQIGEYKIKKRIAQGGMGDVFLAERIDQNIHQNIARTVTRDKDTTGKELLRFEQQRLILSKRPHPNLAKCLDERIPDAATAY